MPQFFSVVSGGGTITLTTSLVVHLAMHRQGLSCSVYQR